MCIIQQIVFRSVFFRILYKITFLNCVVFKQELTSEAGLTG